MSLYSSGSIKTRFFEPVHQDSNTLEFNLDNETAYYSDLKLINLGTHRASSDAYSDAAGCYGKIRAIHLLSNGQKLDSLRDANRYLAFLNSLPHPSEQSSLVCNEAKCKYSLTVSSVKQELDHRKASPSSPSNASVGARARANGALSLKTVFPVLAEMVHLNTSMMKNIKIRVEFETRPERVVTANTNVANQADPVPLLVADQIINESLVSELDKAYSSPVVWNSIEHDQIGVDSGGSPGAGTKVVQQTSRKLLGFNDKFLSRVLVIKQNATVAKDVAGNATVGYGTYASPVQYLEKFNVRLNGKNLFVGSGLDTPAKMTMMCADTFGASTMAQGDDRTSIGIQNDIDNAATTRYQGMRTKVGNKVNPKVGQCGYIGFSIVDQVQDLQLDYERTNVNDTDVRNRYNNPLILHVYGEVRKMMKIDRSGFRVSYM